MDVKKLTGEVKVASAKHGVVTLHIVQDKQRWSAEMKMSSVANCIEPGDTAEIDHGAADKNLSWVSKHANPGTAPLLLDVFNVQDITPAKQKPQNMKPQVPPTVGYLKHPNGYMVVAGKRYNNGWPVDSRGAVLIGVDDNHSVAEGHIDLDRTDDTDLARYRKVFDATQVKYYIRMCESNTIVGMNGTTQYLELASTTKLTVLFCFNTEGRFIGYAMKDS